VAITGVHALIYTSEPDAVRAVFRDVFGWEHVDLGDNWLIFKLPPSELGIHPSQYEVRRDVSLMCDDLERTMSELQAKGIQFEGEPLDEGWGITTTMVLPGDTKLMLYEPRHETAI
jgi:catechol 2,3-dioxygenase-like lactoylglutathione lyase family enzyme